MKKKTSTHALRIALFPAISLWVATALAQTPEKPQPPPDDWTQTNFSQSNSACVQPGCKPFDLSAHAAMTPQGEQCSNELNAAIYRQDVLHAFEAKAHFDNCAFDDATSYVDELVAETLAQLRAGPTPRPGANELQSPHAKAAALAMGQALHAIQDFYAHSNYVELIQAQMPNIRSQADLPLVEIWKPSGKARLAALKTAGLVSGRVWWGVPQRCSAAVPTHANLAKDSPGTPAGGASSSFKRPFDNAVVVNNEVATNLAVRASREFLAWMATQAPQLEAVCGSTVRFIVQRDRRSE